MYMRPYMNLKGKGRFANFWGDKVQKKFKKIFKKSERQTAKKEVKNSFGE